MTSHNFGTRDMHTSPKADEGVADLSAMPTPKPHEIGDVSVAKPPIPQADDTPLMSDNDLENFSIKFSSEWPEYEKVVDMYRSLKSAAQLVNTKID